MALINDLTDALARDVVAAMDELGDDRFHEKYPKCCWICRQPHKSCIWRPFAGCWPNAKRGRF